MDFNYVKQFVADYELNGSGISFMSMTSCIEANVVKRYETNGIIVDKCIQRLQSGSEIFISYDISKVEDETVKEEVKDLSNNNTVLLNETILRDFMDNEFSNVSMLEAHNIITTNIFKIELCIYSDIYDINKENCCYIYISLMEKIKELFGNITNINTIKIKKYSGTTFYENMTALVLNKLPEKITYSFSMFNLQEVIPSSTGKLFISGKHTLLLKVSNIIIKDGDFKYKTSDDLLKSAIKYNYLNIDYMACNCLFTAIPVKDVDSNITYIGYCYSSIDEYNINSSILFIIECLNSINICEYISIEASLFKMPDIFI